MNFEVSRGRIRIGYDERAHSRFLFLIRNGYLGSTMALSTRPSAPRSPLYIWIRLLVIVLSDSVLLRTSSWTCLWTPSWISLSDPPQTLSWTPPSKVTHFLLTALHRTATFGPDLARPSFDLGQTPLGTDLGGVPSEHTVKP